MNVLSPLPILYQKEFSKHIFLFLIKKFIPKSFFAHIFTFQVILLSQAPAI